MFHRIAILGLGLIGGSLARALKQKRPGLHVAAFDPSPGALAFAAREGFIDSRHDHASQAAHEADIVMLAAPPSAFAALAADIAPSLKAGAVVTDAASVKRAAISAVAPHLPQAAHFVPGHPIAGSERSGVQASSADLFTGRRVILTPPENALLSEPVACVRALWEMAGARMEYMPAALHDRIYAYVSHLPQLVAFAARACMRDLPPPDEPSARFARLMRSDPALWADICLANADSIDDALGDFLAFARQMQGELSAASGGGEETSSAAALFPRVVAVCLIAAASLLQETDGIHPARYAGAGFADMTAPASGEPEALLAAVSSHHRIIALLLEAMLARLEALRGALRKGEKSLFLKLL